MATPKELVEKVSEETGVPLRTVIVHDRNLLNAGLRSEGVRGRGKSVVTFQDAANLLIAVAGSRNVKDSAKTVREYGGLPASHPLEFGDEIRGKTFGDAIAALLEAMPTARDAFSSDYASVDVYIYGPAPESRIEWRFGDKADTIDFYEPDPKSKRPWKSHKPRPFADLQFIAKFTQVTLGHVGELVAG